MAIIFGGPMTEKEAKEISEEIKDDTENKVKEF